MTGCGDASVNKRREDFDTMRQYDDFLEEIETLGTHSFRSLPSFPAFLPAFRPR
jgi:hypothetical protein